MARFPKQTKTEKTKEQHRNRTRQLLNRYMRETGEDFELIEARRFVDWLVEILRDLKPSSFRQYKAAVLYALPKFDICNVWMDEALDRLAAVDQSICNYDGPPRTSASKHKKYPPEFLDRMLDKLAKGFKENDQYRDIKHAPELFAILVGTVAVGLRPIEWGQSEIIIDDETGHGALEVQNAKATNNRANGPSRKVVYGHMPEPVKSIVEYMVIHACNSDDWAKEYNQIADLHYRLQKKLRPRAVKRYAIYSCRHQNIANMKLAEVYDDIAPLVGHGTRRTAAEHYGRKTAGRRIISSEIDCEITAETLPKPGGGVEVAHGIKENRRGYGGKGRGPNVPSPSR